MRLLLLFALIHQCHGTRLEAVPDRAAMHYVHSEDSLLLLVKRIQECMRNSTCRGIGLQYTNETWIEDPQLIYDTHLVINNLYMAYYVKKGGMDCPETGSSSSAPGEPKVTTAVPPSTSELQKTTITTTTVTTRKETTSTTIRPTSTSLKSTTTTKRTTVKGGCAGNILVCSDCGLNASKTQYPVNVNWDAGVLSCPSGYWLTAGNYCDQHKLCPSCPATAKCVNGAWEIDGKLYSRDPYPSTNFKASCINPNQIG